MNTTSYSAAVRELLTDDRLNPLGPGQPNAALKPRLTALTVESLFSPANVRATESGQCCLAALWLYHDFPDEAHTISQDIPTVEGSFWHGILHRREPDYANAAYWFRRVGQHAVFESLGIAARNLTPAVPSPWDPFWFIDFCRDATRGKTDEAIARRIQKLEWELLFDHCYRNAVMG